MNNFTFTSKMVDIADFICYNRPLANRNFDQIFMHASDMIRQTIYSGEFTKEKEIVFLGDGDGMSSSLVLFSEAGIIPKIKSATVLDFDERILNGILRCRDKHGVKIEMNLELYNVIEPIPKKYQGKFDFFYINPPYGSKNEGLSSIVWLYRCMDLIKKDAEGIIVIPYDSNIEWTKDAMVRIQKFLIDNGFVIKEMITDSYYYHLDDNPKLTSSSLLVERTAYKNSKYQDKYMPFELVKNLYGDFLKIPRYIYDDNTPFGKPDYDWKYGDDSWK